MNALHLKNKKRGHVLMFLVVVFVAIALSLVSSIASPILRYLASERAAFSSSQSFFSSESAAEDVMRRLQMGFNVSGNEIQNINGNQVNVAVTDTSLGKSVLAVSNINSATRKIQANFSLGEGVSFHYGVQAGNGGFVLANGASVTGSIYSDGPVTGSGNVVTGDAVSAGSNGLLSGLNINHSAYAHTINNSVVTGNAYYKVSSGSSVGGTRYPNSDDQPILPLPISDALIAEWESDAASGGVASTSCPYTITSDTTLGPIKIPCDVIVKGNSTTLTLAGPVWVKGDITFKTTPTIQISPTLGNKNVPLIADNPDDKLLSGKISMENNSTFNGSGDRASYVFLISGNASAENGGSVAAISLTQGAGAMVAYASHGLINLANSISVKEATAYKITLGNSASVTYDTGLPSVLFKAGPSGGYNIVDWQEIP